MVGKIGNRETKVELFPDDCYLVARERLSHELPLVPTAWGPEYAIAIEWMETGLK